MRILSAMFGIAVALAAFGAHAGDITVKHPWARATAGAAKNGAAFMTVENAGAQADRLLSAKGEVSKTIELHTHIKEGDVMQMRQVEAIEVPAQGSTKLEPGSYHVMFLGLHKSLEEGSSFPLTLVFEHAGEVVVDVKVQGVGAMESGQNHDMGHDKDEDKGKGMKH